MPDINMQLLEKAALIAFGFSLFVSLIICLSMKAKMKSVRKAKFATHYVVDDQVVVHESTDSYSHSTVEVHTIAHAEPVNKNNGF